MKNLNFQTLTTVDQEMLQHVQGGVSSPEDSGSMELRQTSLRARTEQVRKKFDLGSGGVVPVRKKFDLGSGII